MNNVFLFVEERTLLLVSASDRGADKPQASLNLNLEVHGAFYMPRGKPSGTSLTRSSKSSLGPVTCCEATGRVLTAKGLKEADCAALALGKSSPGLPPSLSLYPLPPFPFHFFHNIC